jgi:hypothetical protein
MNRYNFSWKQSPLDVLSIQKSEKQYCDDYDELHAMLKNHTVRIIKNTSMEQLRDDFCQYRNSSYSGYPELVHQLNRYEPLNYNEQQRKSMMILQSLFPEFTDELNQMKLNKTEWYNFADHVINANWKTTLKLTHEWLHTVTVAGEISDRWYNAQLLYRAGHWLRGFKRSDNPKWNLPICIYMYHYDDTNYMHIHPGNSRNMFKAFDDVATDVILIFQKKDEKFFSDLGSYDYYDTEQKLKEMCEHKRVEYIIDESGYVELFFLPKDSLSLNDEAVLFFNEKQRTEYINYCRELVEYKKYKNTKHPPHIKFEYDLHIELKDGIIYYQDERVANIDSDGSLSLFSHGKKFLFNLL